MSMAPFRFPGCMPEYRIPFNRPGLTGDELRYVADAITRGHTAGDGGFTRKCSALLEAELKVARVLLTTSCTHALEMAAFLLDLKDGDEVIVPSFTFVSTANAFLLRGAKPVFVDIRPDTLNLDESRIRAELTPRTRAIIPVHYAGVGCEMDTIVEIAREHRLEVVEDNAHGLFGRYKGKYLGTIGGLATQSFHETKNIICGEGGALVLNDPKYIERAEILREKGTNRNRFFRGEVDKYTWVDLGSSYLPSDILAAFLFAQLEKRERIQFRRSQIWTCYQTHLRDWAEEHGIGMPSPPLYCAHPYHMFYLIMPSLQDRQRLIEHLKVRSILSVFHYMPLHISDMGRKLGGYPGQCPVTERVSDCLVRLPFYNDLTEADQTQVIAAIREFPFHD
jgi:dTDP-4-amino-4,6-dideoxygalactose transaminase